MKEPIPEPWMFGVEASVDGAPLQPQVVRFTLLGRLRMAWRVFRGRPPVVMTLTEEQDD